MTTITEYMRNKLGYGIECYNSDLFDFYRMCKYHPNDVKKMWEIFASNEKEMTKLQFLPRDMLQEFNINGLGKDICKFLYGVD